MPTIPPTPTPTTQQQIQQLATNSGIMGGQVSVKYTFKDKSAIITETVGESWDNNSAKVTIKNDCFDIQKAIWTNHISVSTTEVDILGPLVDQYGNQSTDMVGSCSLSKDTASRFNWDNLDYETAWDNGDYDTVWLLPSLNS